MLDKVTIFNWHHSHWRGMIFQERKNPKRGMMGFWNQGDDDSILDGFELVPPAIDLLLESFWDAPSQSSVPSELLDVLQDVKTAQNPNSQSEEIDAVFAQSHTTNSTEHTDLDSQRLSMFEDPLYSVWSPCLLHQTEFTGVCPECAQHENLTETASYEQKYYNVGSLQTSVVASTIQDVQPTAASHAASIELLMKDAYQVYRKGFEAICYQTAREGRLLEKVREETDLPTRPAITIRLRGDLGSQSSIVLRIGLQITSSEIQSPIRVMRNVFALSADFQRDNAWVEDGVLCVCLNEKEREFSLWDSNKRFLIPFRYSTFDHVARRLRRFDANRKGGFQDILRFDTRLFVQSRWEDGSIFHSTSETPLLVVAHKKQINRLGLGSRKKINTHEQLVFAGSSDVSKQHPTATIYGDGSMYGCMSSLDDEYQDD